MRAGNAGHTELVAQLISLGANVNQLAVRDQWTALMNAATEGHTEVTPAQYAVCLLIHLSVLMNTTECRHRAHAFMLHRDRAALLADSSRSISRRPTAIRHRAALACSC
jgi:ankyrin repeat protein